MKKLLSLLFVFPILGIAQNTVCFTINPNPNTNDPALEPFTKYVDVLGCFKKIGFIFCFTILSSNFFKLKINK